MKHDYFALYCPKLKQWIGQNKQPTGEHGTPFLWGQRRHAEACIRQGKAKWYNLYYGNQFKVVRMKVKVDPRDLGRIV